MKFFYKLCAVILVIGIVMCIAGAAAGGDLYASYYNGRLHGLRETRSYIGYIDELPRWRVDLTDNYYAGVGMTDSERGGGRADAHFTDDLDDIGSIPAIDFPEVTELDLELGAGNYHIVEGDDFGIDGGAPSWLSSVIEDGVWKVRCSSTLSTLIKNAGDVTLTVPAGVVFDTVEMEIGAANVIVDAAIAADTIDIDLGAGNLEFYSCGVLDELDADVGMGSLSLALTEKWAEYRLDADAAMGTITINGEPFVNGLAGETHTGTGARKLDFDLGMGSIEIVTAD